MNDDELGPLLRDAVSDIRPRRGLSDLERRLERAEITERTPTGLVVAAVAAGVALLCGTVAWIGHEDKVPPAVTSLGSQLDVHAYYLGRTGAGTRLFRETHQLNNVTGNQIQAAVDQTLSAPDDPDYTTAFPAGTEVDVSQSAGQVNVDFTGSSIVDAKASASQAALAEQALVWTIADAVGRPVPVTFTVGGQPATTLFGHPVTQPVREQNEDYVMSPVWLGVEEGATLPSNSVITGEANAFEGTVQWQLLQGSVVVRHGVTTALQSGTLTPYSFTLVAPPGSYTLRVSDTDPSGGEGYGTTTDSKDIVISDQVAPTAPAWPLPSSN